MNQFSMPVRVYIEDTDAGGIVFYVNYLKYMERARTELLRTLGFAKPALTNNNGLLVVGSAQVDYKRSAFLDDQLSVTAGLIKIARSYVVFEQCVFRGEELLCKGSIKVACVDRENLRPQAMPEDLYEALTDWAEN